MKLIKLFASHFCVIAAAFALSLGQASAEETEGEKPWLYKGSDVPVDKAWTFGTLSNGLRYAVRHNAVPARQVSIRIRIDAGSLMEDDHERGYAHFLEHLTFRGSTYVPDGEAKRVWQRFGASFGDDSNAETTPTQTVYKLDLPNASKESLSESIKILSGMMRNPGLTDKVVQAEKPVVLAELNENKGPQFNVSNRMNKLLFRGQRFENRAPIGTVETLSAATSGSLRAFHRRWYRPKNIVIAIAGDGDPKVFVQLLDKYFANWMVNEPAREIPDFGSPQEVSDGQGDFGNSELIVEPTLPRSILLATLRPWHQVNDTVVYNEGLMIDILAQHIINRRLEGAARRGGNFLTAGVRQEDVYRSADGTFTTIVPLNDDWEAAIADVRAIIADALIHPPSIEDIEREYAELEAGLKIGVEGYPSEAGATQADKIITAVDIREAVATPQTALEIFRGIRLKLTPDAILKATQKLFKGGVQRVFATSPTEIDGGKEKLSRAIEKEAIAIATARVAQEELKIDQLPKLGPPGKISERHDVKGLGIEQLTLSNGVKVLLSQTDSEREKILVRVRFGKGYKSVSPAKNTTLWSGELALTTSGIGRFNLDELERMTNGRRISLEFSVQDDAFVFSASTRAADLKDQLLILATKLEYPRWAEAPLARAKASALIGYDSYNSSPQTVLERDLKWLMRNKDRRWKAPSKQELQQLTLDRFRRTWEPILKSGPVEVMIYGDFKKEETVKAVLETLGAMTVRKPQYSPRKARRIQFPNANQSPEILRHKGDKEQAIAVIAWPTSGGMDDIGTSRKLEVLARIFSDRLFEKFRSEEGASYSPSVGNSWPENFDAGGSISAISQVSPNRVGRFYEVAKKIAADLVAKPVSEDELKRVTEPLRQLIIRASSANLFWIETSKGATRDKRVFKSLRTLLPDYTKITPEEVRQLAERYLKSEKSWSLAILPENIELPRK